MQITSSLDPRAWNLFASAALVAGCGAHTVAGDAGKTSASTESTESTEETESTDTDPTAEPECLTDEDCGSQFCDEGACVECIVNSHCSFEGYAFCENNMCYYAECDPYNLCPPYSYCDYYEGVLGNCVDLGLPPPACEPGLASIPTFIEPGAAPLVLSFANIDDDVQDELVVATESTLLVYESGDDTPTMIPRDVPSADNWAMVAGQFDDQPGDDLVLLVSPDYHRFFADGLGGFASQSVSPGPLGEASDLLAGDFDGIAPTDLLVWGQSGAVLDLGDETVPLEDDDVSHAAALDQSAPEPGVLLSHGSFLRLFDLMGSLVSSTNGVQVWSVTTLSSAGVHRYAGHDVKHPSSIWLWDPVTLGGTRILHPRSEFDLAAGDFDGDQAEDLATVESEVVTLIFDPLAALDPRGEPCLATIELNMGFLGARDHAVGDHDGDGDDELAMISQTGAVVIIDGE